MNQSCPICFTSIQETPISLPECPHSFCSDCFTQYLTTEITTLRSLKIKCPQENCSHSLHTTLIQKLLPPETFQIYKKAILAKIQARTSGHFCPQSGCSKPLTLTPNSSSTTCTCGARICNECCDFYHEGKTCFEALDPEFEAYMDTNNIRSCLMCKTVVDRVEGCTHITCPVCDYEWCWLCGHEYNQYHGKDCSRTWNPSVPLALVIEDKEEAKKLTEQPTIKKLTSVMVSLCLEQVFWPFLQLEVKKIMNTVDINPSTKIERVTIALFLNLLYFAAFIFFKWMMWKFPANAGFFMILFSILLLVPWLVKAFCYYGTTQELKKRWRSRNFKSFGYTKHSKPNVNAENHIQIDVSEGVYDELEEVEDYGVF